MSEQRDLCVVFADVSGSTRLYEKLGDADALRAIDRCVQSMTRATIANKGRVVKTIGDEVMAVFDSAAQGMQAACEMQLRIDEMAPIAPGTKLAIRVGFHFGPAIVENSDIFGDTVNTAARMAGLAKAGQIITTGATVAALPDMLRESCREIDALAVKGKAEDVHVCEVIWQENAELTMMSGKTAPAAPVEKRLLLRRGSEEMVLGATRPVATLGRDLASDMVFNTQRASRSHAKIELRRDKFVLVDMSSNGTYVTFDGQAEMVLKREEVLLHGSGWIVLGNARAVAEPAEMLSFSVDA